MESHLGNPDLESWLSEPSVDLVRLRNEACLVRQRFFQNLGSSRRMVRTNKGEIRKLLSFLNAPCRSRTCNLRFRRSTLFSMRKWPKASVSRQLSRSDWQPLDIANFAYFTVILRSCHNFSDKSDTGYRKMLHSSRARGKRWGRHRWQRYHFQPNARPTLTENRSSRY